MPKLYEGARVECFNTGLYLGDIVKLDVKSMYPSIMIVFNLSPESTRIAKIKPYTGEYRFAGNVIEVPDKTLKKQVVVETGSEDSVSRNELLRFMSLREEYKKQGNKSAQLAVKIVMNSLYGYNGLVFARYGSFAVAVVVTAIGRFIMDKIIEVCRRFGVTLLECDSDGIIYKGRELTDEVNSELHNLFRDYEYCHVLRVEPEFYDGALVYASKNYVLKDGNRLIFKGSAFKGRHHPPICRVALERFVRALFNGEDPRDVWLEFYNLKRFPFQDFIMEVEMGKELSEYKGERALAKVLAEQLGDNVRFGESIRFVKTVRGYVPLGVQERESLKQTLDYSYYRERIKDVVSRVLTPVRKQKNRKLYEFMCRLDETFINDKCDKVL